MKSVGKRSVTTVLDSEDEPMSMDSDSPGEEESDFDNLKIPPPLSKRHTLVDCFQEVLDASPWRDRVALAANPSGSGLFERLQQVMHPEKERELFLNNLEPSGVPLCGISCLHVLIISSYLDAKLIVCHCSLKKIPERLQESVSQWRGERTVIFSPRICSDVDLEVGKLICICPPWYGIANSNLRLELARPLFKLNIERVAHTILVSRKIFCFNMDLLRILALHIIMGIYQIFLALSLPRTEVAKRCCGGK
ncbi:uncharacterized protein LOC116215959 isoform X2 [Punica granatum]|nr:uncharacterized protein LOC116215959 isoform X2 [Punica granatum]